MSKYHICVVICRCTVYMYVIYLWVGPARPWFTAFVESFASLEFSSFWIICPNLWVFLQICLVSHLEKDAQLSADQTTAFSLGLDQDLWREDSPIPHTQLRYPELYASWIAGKNATLYVYMAEDHIRVTQLFKDLLGFLYSSYSFIFMVHNLP